MTWRELLDLLTWNDFADIAVVTVLLYNLLILIRGTRAVQILLGLLAVVGVYQVARLARNGHFRPIAACSDGQCKPGHEGARDEPHTER